MKTIFQSIILMALVQLIGGCTSSLPAPPSHLIAGVWRMDKVTGNAAAEQRDYSQYQITFRKTGDYLLVNEFGKQSFGRWAMQQNGKVLVIDYYTALESRLFIESLTADDLILQFNQSTETTTFSLKRP